MAGAWTMSWCSSLLDMHWLVCARIMSSCLSSMCLARIFLDSQLFLCFMLGQEKCRHACMHAREDCKGNAALRLQVPDALASKVHDVFHLPDISGSDHCPIGLVLRIDTDTALES